jgi:AraC-like DNA-binding protein
MKTWITPIPALKPFVTQYVVLEMDAPLSSPVPAKTEVVLAFGPGHRNVLFDHRTGRSADALPAVVVGPHTRHLVDLHVPRGFTGLYVIFTPGGFFRLFGVDVSEVTDHSYDAGSVLGLDVAEVSDAVNSATSVRAKVCAVETFLLAQSAQARRERATDRAARCLKATHGRLELGPLVSASGVSERQFRRDFVAHLGMSPKHFAKILRFEYALRLKDTQPWMSWAQVSQEAGYYDQTHLVKDCQSLGAAPPTSLLHLVNSPVLTLSDESLPTREQVRRLA